MISLKKRAQIKVQEMSFMLLFLFIFFILVLLFYLAVSLSGLKETFYENSRAGYILLASRLADSPELSCGGSESLCVDADKLVVFIGHENYKNFWSLDGLVVKRIYHGLNVSKECNIGNYPNCNTYVIKRPGNNSIADASYVNLCRKDTANGYSYTKCEIGKIFVYTTKNEKK